VLGSQRVAGFSKVPGYQRNRRCGGGSDHGAPHSQSLGGGLLPRLSGAEVSARAFPSISGFAVRPAMVVDVHERGKLPPRLGPVVELLQVPQLPSQGLAERLVTPGP
jgi:hypothetical protein